MKTCIVIDDASVVRRIARRMLERKGFSVLEAESGMEALAMCRSRMPDLILLDLHMPSMNGMEFLALLRKEDGGQVPRVIVCTTEYDIEEVAAAMYAGGDACLMKPFDRETMKTALSEIFPAESDKS